MLITTCYRNCDADLFSKHTAESGIYLEYDGNKNGSRVSDPDDIGIRTFKGDGDFRSAECIELLKQADIVVTNPPFSLFPLPEYRREMKGGDWRALYNPFNDRVRYGQVGETDCQADD